MAILRTSCAITASVVSALFTTPLITAAQDGGTGSIRVHPNLATQARDGFTVCAGTAQNRTLYGTRVTGSTGIVTFPGIPFGTAVVTTVTKAGFGGREQNWLVPAPGSSRDVIIYMFTGSGGPACTGTTTIAGSAPPPPPATSTVSITADPGPSTGRGGFYVCVGTSQNRAAYGYAVTSATAVTRFSNLPAGGMIKATMMRAGYAGVERDWYPTPGQQISLAMTMTPGSGGFTCPGYTAPIAKEIRSAVSQAVQQAEVGLPVAVPPAVRVLDQYNNGLAGVTVTFSATQGGGTITPASAVTTGFEGTARATAWSLGPNAGTNQVTASIQGSASTPVIFNATGIQVPKTLEAVTPLTQQGLTGTPVSQPPGVLARDRNGNPVAGASIAFTPSGAGGTVAPVLSVPTGSDGIARLTRWTLGSTLGTSTVLASVNTLRLVFSATVLAQPTTTIVLPLPDLQVRVAQSSNPIVAGSNQTYTVKVHNRGSAGGTAIALRSALPADLVFSSIRADRGFVCSRSGTAMNCAGGALSAGDSATIRLVMSLALTARSGHQILLGTQVDPDNTLRESNESNNTAAAVAMTEAAVAPVAVYRLTAANDLAELFQLAKANGFEFRASSLDKDILGNPVKCWIGMPSPDGRNKPLMGARSDVPPLGGEFRCHYEFFGRTKMLAAGWQLLSTEWTTGLGSSWGYVEAPKSTSGNAFFSTQARWSLPVSTDGRQWITALTLRGPVASDWRDAFR